MSNLQTNSLTGCAHAGVCARVKLNVLIACEESQAECAAFRELGHNAFSCDLQPCRPSGNPAWHIQGDCLPYIDGATQFVTQDGVTHSVIILLTPNQIYYIMRDKISKKANSIHELAIALCEKRNVWFHGHTIRLVEATGDKCPCNLCDMDSICDEEMVELCGECYSLLKRPCILKLVTRHI